MTMERELTNTPAGLNRRAVLRTGRSVAWSLPAVHVVLQSPVYATSGPAALSVTAAGRVLRDEAGTPNRMSLTTTVANLNGAPTDDLRVTYRLPDGVSATALPPPGWSVVSGNGTGTIVLSVDTELAGSASTGPCECVFECPGLTGQHPVAVTIVATPGGSGAPGTAVASLAV